MDLASDLLSGDVLKLARRKGLAPASWNWQSRPKSRHVSIPLRDVTTLEIATTKQSDVTYIFYTVVQVLVRCPSSRYHVMRAVGTQRM